MPLRNRRSDNVQMLSHARSFRQAGITLAVAVLLVLCPWRLRSQLPDAPSPGGSAAQVDQYAGDDACRSCHREQFDTYLGTAHHAGSRLPSESSIKGKFTADADILRTSNPYLYFRMTATPDGYFQTAYAELPPSETVSHRERFGL